MRTVYSFLTSAFFLLLVSSCQKDEVYPTQASFDFVSIGSGDTALALIDSGWNSIAKFNIDYYPRVDSVIMAGYAYVDEGQTATVSLYNATDHEIITGSSVAVVGAGGYTPVYFQTGNAASGFPHKEITVGYSIKNHVSGKQTTIFNNHLYVYYKVE